LGVLQKQTQSPLGLEADRPWMLEAALRDWTVLRALQNRSWSSDKALMLEVVQCSWEALAVASPSESTLKIKDGAR